MRYLKLVISLILALVIIVAVVWFGLVVLLISAIIAPFFIWWVRSRAVINKSVYEETVETKSSNGEAEYKVIDAEYEIIDKDK